LDGKTHKTEGMNIKQYLKF